MFTTFTKVIAVAALVSAGATQASANNRDEELGRIIGGVALLTILGLALSDNNNAGPRHHVSPRPTPEPHPVRLPRLPAQCVMGVPTHQGPVEIYGARCLQQEYRFADRLPSQCATTVDGAWGGTRRGYDPRCLELDGFRSFN